MERKTILVIPGAQWQIDIVKKLKSMGHRVLTVNPHENSPAFPYSDGYLKCDIFDEKQVIAYCQKEQVDAIISDECDIAMPLVARYGKKLNLITLSEEAAHLFTDKYAMREHCREHGFPYPLFQKCTTIDEALSFFDVIGGKMILKPLDSNSSRGVYTVNNKEDIERYFADSLSYSLSTKAIIIEQYIPGTEFTVDGIKTPEKHFSLAISEKKHYKHNENIACELYFSHKNPQYDYDLLRKTNDALINSSCLNFGLTHAEYKLYNGNFYLIEMAARGGGNMISSLISPYMSGVDNYDYLIDCCTDYPKHKEFEITNRYQTRTAVLKFFDPPINKGLVVRIEGEECLKKKQVAHYQFNFSIGDIIAQAKNDAARVGFYIAMADNNDELNSIMTSITEDFKIICE